MIQKLILAAVLFTSCSCYAADRDSGVNSYWSDRARGWFWYEDPELADKPKKGEKPAEQAKLAVKPKRLQDMDNAADIRAEVQRLLDIATANPTKENVKTYMEANMYVLNKAGEFTNVWTSVLRETPSLDSTIQNPVNALGMRTKQEDDINKQAKKVSQLGETHGLFFFFKGDCPFCHAFAPTLQLFAKQFGLEVFPVSLDGGALPEYPKPALNNGMADKLAVTTVPALYLGNKLTGEVQPIGYGVLAVSDLISRIYAIATKDAK